MVKSDKNRIKNQKYAYWKGKKQSPETIAKRSKAMIGKVKGEKNGMFGKKHSADTLLKMSKARIKYVGENSPAWKGGYSCLPYCYKFNKKIKEKIRNRDNRECQLCYKTDVGLKRKHHVHHVHYDKKNCNPDMITLCHKCNLGVNKNKDYWENYFVELLRKRGLLIITPP